MDLNLLRALLTVIAFAAFLGIVAWAYAPGRRSRLEAEGRRILEDREP
jgi:cbb3-type cytochrome oxidase subunit 3